MKARIIYFVFFLLFHPNLMSQTDTLICNTEFNIPNVGVTSLLNLAYDGTNLWLSEHSGIIYKINPDGLCVDTLNTSKTTSTEFAGDDLWMVQDDSDRLWKLNKNTGQVIDSVKIEMPEVLAGAYQCRDLSYIDSAIYSVWAYCWCGVNRFLKLDLKTNETTDLGDIPLH